MTTAAERWRLALGRYAEENLGGLSGMDAEREAVLDWLYGREYAARGIGKGQGGGPGASQPHAIRWLEAARRLFPKKVALRLQADAIGRYRLADLLSDPDVLAAVTPDAATLRVLLSLRGAVDPALQRLLRATVRRVIDEIVARLRPRVEIAFSGRRNRFRRSTVARAANFDARATLRANLKSWDGEARRLVAERLHFNARQHRHLPWSVVLCVDQSGSMTNSVIHSAVMAAILCGLPGVRVKMVLFDTAVVDVTDRLADPLETLMTVRLGGGTDIARAVTYCEGLIEDPGRTVFVLVTDFCEGGPVRRLERAVARLVEARVRTLGLAALEDGGAGAYDRGVAGRLAGIGMQIGAMTPDALAEWLAEVMA